MDPVQSGPWSREDCMCPRSQDVPIYHIGRRSMLLLLAGLAGFGNDMSPFEHVSLWRSVTTRDWTE
jgi:hypothetical protein